MKTIKTILLLAIVMFIMVGFVRNYKCNTCDKVFSAEGMAYQCIYCNSSCITEIEIKE